MTNSEELEFMGGGKRRRGRKKERKGDLPLSFLSLHFLIGGDGG